MAAGTARRGRPPRVESFVHNIGDDLMASIDALTDDPLTQRQLRAVREIQSTVRGVQVLIRYPYLRDQEIA